MKFIRNLFTLVRKFSLLCSSAESTIVSHRNKHWLSEVSHLLDLTPKSRRWILDFNRSESTMVADLDEAVSIYRDLTKIPKVKLGRICSEEAPGHLQIYSEWLQADLVRNEQIKFARGHIVQLDVIIPTPPYELSNEQWNKESPSGRYKAIVRKLKDKKGEEKQFLEIWSDTRKLRNIDVLAVDRHGLIYADDQFGSLEWSHSETHLLYVAERKVPKTKSYFDEKPETGSGSAVEIEKGNEFVYKENWGEQLSEKMHPVLCVLDIEGGCISLLENIPDNISPGQAVWCPDDLGVVCVGWWHDSPRLGLIYCPIRRSALFHIDLKTFTCTILGADDRSVRSPIFSPDNSKLIYLDNESGGPHAQCSRLVLCDWPTKGIVPVVDIVRHAPADEFQGIFTLKLDSKCWSLDSKRVVLSTNWRSKVELVVVYIETGAVIRLTDDRKIGRWTLLDVHNDLILAACSSVCQPDYLVIGHLPSSGSERSIKWTRLDSEPTALPEISWKICPVSVPPIRVHPKYSHLDYEYIFLEPRSSDDYKPPLVVYNHGGPHAAFVADFQIYLAGLCRCGFALLLVNYRGSYGFGADSIDSLPGQIGTQDVLDVQSEVEAICSSGRVDADKVFVIGGSHGGFLSAHLVGQYPEFYKAAAIRNPVINIASMLGGTDIPDWSFVETGLPYDHNSLPTSDTYFEMLKRSPIVNVDKIKTPLMLMIGGKDLRVPPSQGLQMKNALEGRGKTVRTLWYPDCCHPLSDVPSEADAFINIVKWFIQHLNA